jgi:hypothetical protein
MMGPSEEVGFCVRANKEQWIALCEQVATEEDPEKVAELVAAIIAALDAKQKRLKGLHSKRVPDPPT